MPSLRSTTGDVISFDQRCRVGRTAGNDLRIDLDTVSSDHGVLEERGGGLYVRDLGSTNGTRVKGRRILGWTRLDVGDSVRFGPDSEWEVIAVEGTGLRDGAQGAAQIDSTVSERSDRRSYDLSLRLVHERPGEGRIEIEAAGGSAVFHGVPNRFVLLLVLARVAAGKEEGFEGGWVDDERLRIALWGRAGAASRYHSALGKVIYDTRKMISAKGLDPFFIEKSKGRTRLRIDPERIVIEGE